MLQLKHILTYYTQYFVTPYETFPEWIRGKWSIDTTTAASDPVAQALAPIFGSAELEFTDTKAIREPLKIPIPR